MTGIVLKVVEEAESKGIRLRLVDGKVKAALPAADLTSVTPLLERLRVNRAEVLDLLRERAGLPPSKCYLHGYRATWWQQPVGRWICQLCHPSPCELDKDDDDEQPTMPPGVRLLQWELKQPPIMLTRYSIVIDPAKFVRRILEELRSALEGKNWLAGNWSVAELIDRLEQVGVVVQLEDPGRQQ